MNPYANLAEKGLWAPAVGRRDPLKIAELWDPKWPIKRRHRIVTFGSCFAQHIGRALKARRFGWTDYEPAPEGMSEETAKTFNFGVFSARTGNIYTANMLRQWVEWALGLTKPPEELWEKAGRFYDPFRPAIEPDGFASAAEALAARDMTLEAFRTAIRECHLFVFTLGLTESWVNREMGYEYAICPGTVAGKFDAEKHGFVKQSFGFVRENLEAALKMIRSVNPTVRVLLTVSPVPLTATASGQHVLVATVESKSVLRAVAAEVADNHARVDYFPSYEIISSPPFEGQFFAENKRSVRPEGVAFVMAMFFSCQQSKFGTGQQGRPDDVKQRKAADEAGTVTAPAGAARPRRGAISSDDDVVCEEQLLGAFALKRK